MRQFITRRILYLIPTIIGASLLIFMIYQLAPGDIVTQLKYQMPNMTEEKEARLREQYNLDKPVLVQYGYWLKDAVRLDFGDSYAFKTPVKEVINKYIWNTVLLSVFVVTVSFLLSVIIGVISAVKQYSFFDMFFTIIAFLGFSVPSFFIGLLLIKFFSVDLGWFPVGGMISTGKELTGMAHIADVAHHMVLPFISLTLLSLGGTVRYTRTSMLEVIKQDYIRTARSKGLKEKVVIYKHALKNALIPVVTIIGGMLPSLFAGSMISEQIFNWPGIGKIALDSINSRDYPLIMGYTVLIAFLSLVGNLISDVLYAVADPRIRLS